jgi:hypothetical protein
MSSKKICSDWTQRAIAVVDKAITIIKGRGSNVSGAIQELAQCLDMSQSRIHNIVYRKGFHASLAEHLTIVQRLEERLDSEELILEERTRAVHVFREELAREKERLFEELRRACSPSQSGQSQDTHGSRSDGSASGAGRRRLMLKTAGGSGLSESGPGSLDSRRFALAVAGGRR